MEKLTMGGRMYRRSSYVVRSYCNMGIEKAEDSQSIDCYNVEGETFLYIQRA